MNTDKKRRQAMAGIQCAMAILDMNRRERRSFTGWKPVALQTDSPPRGQGILRPARWWYDRLSMNDPLPSHPPAPPAADGTDWPVDVQRTDASGEVDLGQLEYNLSLAPRQRIEQNDAWARFIQIARRAGQKLHDKQSANSNSTTR